MAPTHPIGTREEWLAARLDLLEAEKAHTRQSDALAKRRQELPWVRIDTPYHFETEHGRVSLEDLFQGRSQLLVYHFMFGPTYTAGCPSCSSIADGFNGVFVHLENHDVMLWAVSQAPFAKLQEYKKRMGWQFPWASAFGGKFNADFNASYTEAQQASGIEYNYRRENPKPVSPKPVNRDPGKTSRTISGGPESFGEMSGVDMDTFLLQRPGMSAFVLEDGVIYHTYSSYARGLDGLWNMYQWLDRTPKGRNENGVWWRRHDEYAAR